VTTLTTIHAPGGRTLYVVAAVPQIDGGIRFACAPTSQAADQAKRRLAADPTLLDYLGLIAVDDASALETWAGEED
jgi:hypothetical protein